MNFDELEAKYGKLAIAAPQSQNSAPQAKKKKSFWLDQISTVGGIAGGALGTLVTPFAGTAAGGALGSALGEGLENLISGESLGKNVAKEAALGGVFAAGPLRLLKGAAGAGRAAVAGEGLAAALARGGESAVAPSALKTALAGRLNDVATNKATKVLALTQGDKTKILQKTGERAGDIIRRHGIQSVDDIEKAASPLFDDYAKTLASIPTTFTKKELGTAFKNVYEPLLKSGPTGQKRIGEALKLEADNLLKDAGKGLSAVELNARKTAFDKLAYELRLAEPSAANVNKLSRDVISTLIDDSAKAAGVKTSGGTSLKELGGELIKLKRLGDAAGKRLEDTGGRTALGGLGLLPGIAAGSAGGPVGALVGAGANAALNSQAGRRITAGAAQQVAGRAAKGAARSAAPYSLGNIAKRVAPVGLLGALANQASPESDAMTAMPNTQSTINSMVDPLSSNGELYPNDTPWLENGTSGPLDPVTKQPIGRADPFSVDNIDDNVQRILSGGGDMKDVKEYIGLVDALTKLKAPAAGSTKPLNQAQQERADLISALGMTEQAVGAGSINYGPIGSRVEGLKSIFNKADPETLAYKNTVSGLRAAITKARAGASLTAGELKMLQKYTPSETDSEQVVRSKLAQLRQLYGYGTPQGSGFGPEDFMQQLTAEGAF